MSLFAIYPFLWHLIPIAESIQCSTTLKTLKNIFLGNTHVEESCSYPLTLYSSMKEEYLTQSALKITALFLQLSSNQMFPFFVSGDRINLANNKYDHNA